MATAALEVTNPVKAALAYHERTKHRLDGYAAGPETLDWDSQPNPFREFSGCERTPLPLPGTRPETSFAQIYQPGAVAPVAPSLEAIGTLLFHSMALAAWKEYGPDRWALRCNPSSGNLHPTEAYIIARNIPGLANGLFHYVSRDHALELRCPHTCESSAAPAIWIGFSSIHWREAWKYGERAFRYGQLDLGHALGAIRYAAGLLGWRAQMIDGLSGEPLAALLGLNRSKDFTGAEKEDPEILIAIDVGSGCETPRTPTRDAEPTWFGHANLLDPHPMYRWPVIDEVSAATRNRHVGSSPSVDAYPALSNPSELCAADVLRGRRSAQRFDAKFYMSSSAFYRLLDPLLARQIAPWDAWNFAPRVHPIVFVHRVAGLEAGIYALPRRADVLPILRGAMRSDFEWQRVPDAPEHLPLFKLAAADCRAVTKTASCHQAIAADSCFSLSMLSEFAPTVEEDAWRYRQLHWEAGLLGHVLYLEAEAAGLRGTGIGCFFDDAVHALFGIESTQFQSLYHFTVGRPMTDDRIMTLPAYAETRSQSQGL